MNDKVYLSIATNRKEYEGIMDTFRGRTGFSLEVIGNTYSSWVFIEGRADAEALTSYVLQNPEVHKIMNISYIADELKDRYRA